METGENSDASDFMHYLAADSYLMEIDTSALFTVIFVDKSSFNDYDQDLDLVTLNYTFLGNEEMLTRQGVWTSVEMTIPMSSINAGADNDIVVTDVVIFVALGTPADAGLNGTLSLCYVPKSGDWSQVSIF